MRVCLCLPTDRLLSESGVHQRTESRYFVDIACLHIIHQWVWTSHWSTRSNGWQLISDSWVDSVIACDVHSFDSIMILHCFHGSVSAVVVVFVSGFDYSFTQLPRNIQPSQQRRLRAGATIPLSSHGCHLYPRRGDEK